MLRVVFTKLFQNIILAVSLVLLTIVGALADGSDDVSVPAVPQSISKQFKPLNADGGFFTRDDLVGGWSIVVFWSPEFVQSVVALKSAVELEQVLDVPTRVVAVNLGDMRGGTVDRSAAIAVLQDSGLEPDTARRLTQLSDTAGASWLSLGGQSPLGLILVNPDGRIAASYNTDPFNEEPWAVADAAAFISQVQDGSYENVEEAPVAILAEPEVIEPAPSEPYWITDFAGVSVSDFYVDRFERKYIDLLRAENRESWSTDFDDLSILSLDTGQIVWGPFTDEEAEHILSMNRVKSVLGNDVRAQVGLDAHRIFEGTARSISRVGLPENVDPDFPILEVRVGCIFEFPEAGAEEFLRDDDVLFRYKGAVAKVDTIKRDMCRAYRALNIPQMHFIRFLDADRRSDSHFQKWESGFGFSIEDANACRYDFSYSARVDTWLKVEVKATPDACFMSFPDFRSDRVTSEFRSLEDALRDASWPQPVQSTITRRDGSVIELDYEQEYRFSLRRPDFNIAAPIQDDCAFELSAVRRPSGGQVEIAPGEFIRLVTPEQRIRINLARDPIFVSTTSNEGELLFAGVSKSIETGRARDSSSDEDLVYEKVSSLRLRGVNPEVHAFVADQISEISKLCATR